MLIFMFQSLLSLRIGTTQNENTFLIAINDQNLMDEYLHYYNRETQLKLHRYFQPLPKTNVLTIIMVYEVRNPNLISCLFMFYHHLQLNHEKKKKLLLSFALLCLLGSLSIFVLKCNEPDDNSLTFGSRFFANYC